MLFGVFVHIHSPLEQELTRGSLLNFSLENPLAGGPGRSAGRFPQHTGQRGWACSSLGRLPVRSWCSAPLLLLALKPISPVPRPSLGFCRKDQLPSPLSLDPWVSALGCIPTRSGLTVHALAFAWSSGNV